MVNIERSSFCLFRQRVAVYSETPARLTSWPASLSLSGQRSSHENNLSLLFSVRSPNFISSFSFNSFPSCRLRTLFTNVPARNARNLIAINRFHTLPINNGERGVAKLERKTASDKGPHFELRPSNQTPWEQLRVLQASSAPLSTMESYRLAMQRANTNGIIFFR